MHESFERITISVRWVIDNLTRGYQIPRPFASTGIYLSADCNMKSFVTGKSLSEALLFAEHGENMLCTKIVLNVRNNFCTQHVLPRFELEIFMY